MSNLWNMLFPDGMVWTFSSQKQDYYFMVPMEHFRGSRDTKVINEVSHGWLMLFSCLGFQYSPKFCKVSFDSFCMCC